ncbi:FAD:protein FMN transferase [Mariprofundus sp. KV]|nr:FAD:protein FMN transferase [Mariprofundus sp. KV]
MIRLCISIMALLLAACSAPADIRDSRFIMGTLVEFTVAGADEAASTVAITAAANEMQRIENAFTIYGNQNNSVKRFNRSQVGASVQLPEEISTLLATALTIKRESNGAFDPALGRLNRLWGFSLPEAPTSPPSSRAIEQAMPPATCIEKRNSGWARLHETCMLDFGAIAKGYAIDRGIEILRNHGIANAIINAGGDIRLIGSHGDQPWRIGIRHPRNRGEVIQSLELQGDVAVVTSGDYERFYIFKDKRYHHILDPKSGWPANTAQSVTVIAKSAMQADAWSTALFISEGHPDISRNLNIRLLIVNNRGEITKNTL